MKMNRCVADERRLEVTYNELERNGHQAILYDDRVTSFVNSPGAVLPEQGEWVERAHVFLPSSNQPNVCSVCRSPKSTVEGLE